MAAADRASFGLASDEFFFGGINKMEYFHELGRIRLMPRWKSEYRRSTYDLFSQQDRDEFTEIFGTIVLVPFLMRTTLTTGIEYVIFKDLDDPLFHNLLKHGGITRIPLHIAHSGEAKGPI